MSAKFSVWTPAGRSLGLHDRQGKHWHFFDLDPTITARLVGTRYDGDPERSPPGKREKSSTLGYAGRTRGHSVRSRMTMLWSAAGLWLRTHGQLGNGHHGAALDACFESLCSLAQLLQVPLCSMVVRMDGEFATLNDSRRRISSS